MSNESKQVLQLRLGCLSPNLETQLSQQGLEFLSERANKAFQGYVDTLSSMYMDELITDGEIEKIRRRLVKKVAGLVRKIKQ